MLLKLVASQLKLFQHFLRSHSAIEWGMLQSDSVSSAEPLFVLLKTNLGLFCRRPSTDFRNAKGCLATTVKCCRAGRKESCVTLTGTNCSTTMSQNVATNLRKQSRKLWAQMVSVFFLDSNRCARRWWNEKWLDCKPICWGGQSGLKHDYLPSRNSAIEKAD